MKNLKCGLLFAAMIFIMTACSQTISPSNSVLSGEEVSEPSDMSSSPDEPDTSDIVTADDNMPSHEGMQRSPLTNEWVDTDVARTRPIAVMIPNESNALPQYNLSLASILYEANVEGRMTRLMAIFEDWDELEKIGNVRSLRNYYAYWAFEWDAFIVHCGQPFFADVLFDDPATQTINETAGSDSAAFYRDETR